MRLTLAVILLALGLWQAVSDWNATIGLGYAYRMSPVGQALADAAPGFYARLIAAWQGARIPFLWDPLGRTLMALPLSLALLLPAALICMTRRRR